MIAVRLAVPIRRWSLAKHQFVDQGHTRCGGVRRAGLGASAVIIIAFPMILMCQEIVSSSILPSIAVTKCCSMKLLRVHSEGL